MFAAAARFAWRRRWAVLIAYGLLLVPAAIYGPTVLPLLKVGGFEDPDRESWQTYSLLQQQMGAGAGDIIALYWADGRNVDEPEVMSEIVAAATRVASDPEVLSVADAYSTGAEALVSRDRTRTVIVVDLRGDETSKNAAFPRLAKLLQADGLDVRFTGLVPGNLAVIDTIRHDLVRAELIAIPLTALLLLAIFGSASSLLVLLGTAVCTLVLSFGLLRLTAAFTDVSVFAVNTITILGFGLAVDYSLFLVSRFREELARAPDTGKAGAAHRPPPPGVVERALVRTMETTGRAVAFSGVTVATSLCGLFVFNQVLLRSLALGGVIVVLLTVGVALTLMPALLAVLGAHLDVGRIRALGKPPRAAAGTDSPPSADDNAWGRLALMVMRRPLLVTAAVAAVLLALALPFGRFQGTLADARLLPKGSAPRVAKELLDRELAPQQTTPHLVLATVQGDARARGNLEALAGLSERMARVPGVARVDGVFTFVRGASKPQVVDALARGPRADDPELLGSFLKGPWMRFQVLSAFDFDDARSLETVRALRALSTSSVQVRVAGYSAALVDLRAAVRDHAPLMVGFVLAAMFVLLFLVFGSITLPLKAMAMNALSLTASFGAIVWVFQDGRFASLLGYEPLGASDATQPLVMFAVVFGLSMDYEVFILSRVREEYLRDGDNNAAIARGLAATGGLISSAALLLVVVVLAFSTSNILFMKTLGVGMALAIVLDATVVRALLVPATMRLMGRWNWYAPAALVRLWRRTGLSDLA